MDCHPSGGVALLSQLPRIASLLPLLPPAVHPQHCSQNVKVASVQSKGSKALVSDKVWPALEPGASQTLLLH